MGFNWIDGILILIVVLNGLTGWREGLHRILASLAILIGVLWLAIRYHEPVGIFVIEKLGIPSLWRDTIGYLTVWIAAETGFSIMVNMIFMKLPVWLVRSYFNRGLGAIISAIKGLAVAILAMLILTVLPLNGAIKQDILDSQIGGRLMLIMEDYSGPIKTTVDQAAAQVVKFITIKPESGERLDLPIGDNCEFFINTEAEEEMLEYVNERRAEVGVAALKSNSQVREVARMHSQDMFDRKYFSHHNPEGEDAGDRLTTGKVIYQLAGENIAYAPDTETANQGLYDSEGHRRNMLESDFKFIGVGVIDGGICGMMFTQNFID